jgi:hypothetical protein
MTNGIKLVALALLCAVLLGCRGASEPPPTRDPVKPAATPTGDAKILLDLDYYEPMYLLDADSRVIRMRMPWRHLPTPVMAEIGKLTELQKLDLYAANVTDEGLAQLKDLQKLRNLGLGATPVTDKGLVHLYKLEGLRHVWLSKQRISEQAAEDLRAARPGLTVYLQ